jgi:hypothetical protein
VEVRQSGSFSVEEFREDVRQASRSEAEHLIVSYSRKQFLQTGEQSVHQLLSYLLLHWFQIYGYKKTLIHQIPVVKNSNMTRFPVPATGHQFALRSYIYSNLLIAVIEGDGHFSPVGGYHAGKDLVLILDTARFKYPPVTSLTCS